MALTVNGSGGGTPVGTPRIETGSYVGDGQYGASHKMSLTFSGVPQYVRIRMSNGNGDFFPTLGVGRTCFYFSNTTTGYGVSVTLNGNTMTWSSGLTNSTACYAELNNSNSTYYYMALVI